MYPNLKPDRQTQPTRGQSCHGDARALLGGVSCYASDRTKEGARLVFDYLSMVSKYALKTSTSCSKCELRSTTYRRVFRQNRPFNGHSQARLHLLLNKHIRHPEQAAEHNLKNVKINVRLSLTNSLKSHIVYTIFIYFANREIS